MLDVPVDTIYVWVGVSTVSVVAFAIALAFPTGTPPSAVDAARAVDAVSVAPAGSIGTHRVRANEYRLGSHRIGLRGPNGAAHATFAYGPIVPTIASKRLSNVLRGVSPAATFGDPGALERAVSAARNRSAEWRTAPPWLRIRRVSWGDVDATLVG